MSTPDGDERTQIERDVLGYLHAHEHKELLRLVVVGSVDDGKSTLIGRLLHDTGRIYEDQLSAVKRASAKGATRGAGSEAEVDFSLFTDGLRAEREQGITIDVAYRYFTTARRKFIIADTPGHVQYTRNMATGASTANVAVILIDARQGVVAQTRRHAYIASLLGIPHLVACVNKMDLVAWDEAVFARIAGELSAIAGEMGIPDVTCLPISALRGDQVATRGAHAPWYDGPTLLEHLETVPIDADLNLTALRFPVQYVIRPDLDYRGFAGQLASGVVTVGDEIVALPSGRRTKVTAIDTFEGPIATAFAPMSVTLRLTDEIDVSRGDMLVADVPPTIGTRFDAHLVWMSERALDPARSYVLKHTTRSVRAEIERIAGVVDPETLRLAPAETLSLNDIGQVAIRSHQPLFFDAYRTNRATGAFILIDSLTNDTVAAGMIRGGGDEGGARDVKAQVSASERRARLGQAGAAIAIGGPGALERAYLVERVLFDAGVIAAVVPREAAAVVAAAGLVAISVEAIDGATLDGVAIDGSDDDEATARALLAALDRAGRLGEREPFD
ncbi:MAG: sulfate adenylyltransferase subunit CysN [Deltaproteobacteria bacterium]|nr:sulfate adenylyltransferase subunit CysN [Deltaproteobacteria bacterium]